MKLCYLVVILVLITTLQGALYSHQKKSSWYQDGDNLLNENLAPDPINKKAKGVILFVGDGMSVATVTAARVLDGQLKGMTGEENVLSWEKFKNVAFSKTYSVDHQTPDSAATATAFLTGVKTKTGMISVNEQTKRGDCQSSKGNNLMTIFEMAEEAGLSTGVVTTTRITHATPAAAYAHSADRDWENDDDVEGDCTDIATQLIEFPYGDGPEVVLGGGRRNFMTNTSVDPEYNTTYGKRKDGRNLTSEWTKKNTRENRYEYVWRNKEFSLLNPSKVDHILGLFEPSHMKYAYERTNDIAGEPSLTQMVEFAIKVLKKNPKGYFLLVEAGRIDHGHHANKAFLALHDTVELGKAVEIATNITKPNETLIITTADHSHVFTMGGYQSRGRSIFDYTDRKRTIAKDGLRYTTLGYVNGPGAQINKTRRIYNSTDLKDPNFRWESLIPLSSETHGGDDVGIYAQGCQAHLIRGVVEQNYIYHVMDYALCLSKDRQKLCQENGLVSAANLYEGSKLLLILVILLILLMKIL